jgi:hypothetical protein
MLNCELYTLQISIYNLHVELNFNVHAVFSLSVKSWSMSLNKVCFRKYSEWWCQRRWIGSIAHFYKLKISTLLISSCNCDICHLPDFITFFFIEGYVALINQAVVERRRWCKSAQYYQSTVSDIIIHYICESRPYSETSIKI